MGIFLHRVSVSFPVILAGEVILAVPFIPRCNQSLDGRDNPGSPVLPLTFVSSHFAGSFWDPSCQHPRHLRWDGRSLYIHAWIICCSQQPQVWTPPVPDLQIWVPFSLLSRTPTPQTAQRKIREIVQLVKQQEQKYPQGVALQRSK